MNINEYQKKALQTAVYPGKGTIPMGLAYTALGLGEAGEFQNKVKKVLRDCDGELNEEMREKLIDELGDVMWYVATCAYELNILLSEVCGRNLNKLHNRQVRGKLKGSGDNR